MKTQLNEIKRMQQLARLINENEEENIVDFCNNHFEEIEQKFGKIGSKFGSFTLDNGIKVAGAGIDENDGIEISFDPKFMDYSNDYNEIEDYMIAGKTVYVNNYLNPKSEK